MWGSVTLATRPRLAEKMDSTFTGQDKNDIKRHTPTHTHNRSFFSLSPSKRIWLTSLAHPIKYGKEYELTLLVLMIIC